MKNPNTGEPIAAKVEEFKGKPILVIPTAWNKEKAEAYTMSFGMGKAKAIVEYIDDIKRFVDTNGTMQDPPV